MHGLRASMIAILQEAGLSDGAIFLRTAHGDVSSLKPYTNLRGHLGIQQLQALSTLHEEEREVYAPTPKSMKNNGNSTQLPSA